MDEKQLESIATTIADYRAGEIDAPTKEHVKQWVEQFPGDSRDKILAEMVHILGKTYISKANVETFLSAVVTNEKLTGGDAKKFWLGARPDPTGGGDHFSIFSRVQRVLTIFRRNSCLRVTAPADDGRPQWG
jgi:hypothetical protein